MPKRSSWRLVALDATELLGGLLPRKSQRRLRRRLARQRFWRSDERPDMPFIPQTFWQTLGRYAVEVASTPGGGCVYTGNYRPA
jgi:hypothetical protein